MDPPPADMPESVNAGVDFGQAAERVVASALALVGGRRARLYRLDPHTGALICAASAGDGEDAQATSTADSAIARRALQVGTAICIPDALVQPDLGVEDAARELIRVDDAGAFAAIPLPGRAEMAAALVVADRTGRRYTDRDVALLGLLAEQMALVFESARSSAELRRQRHEARELARVARLFSETLDLSTVGERIADS